MQQVKDDTGFEIILEKNHRILDHFEKTRITWAVFELQKWHSFIFKWSQDCLSTIYKFLEAKSVSTIFKLFTPPSYNLQGFRDKKFTYDLLEISFFPCRFYNSKQKNSCPWGWGPRSPPPPSPQTSSWANRVCHLHQRHRRSHQHGH